MQQCIMRYLMLCLLLFSNYKAYSQQFKNFSSKPETFTSEIHTFIGETKDDDLKKVYNTFSFLWDSSKFSQEEKKEILITASCLVDKKIRPIPDFYSFLKTLNAFKESKHPTNSFDKWLTGISNYCSMRKISVAFLNRLIFSTYNLLNENALNKSSSLTWKATNNNFIFEADSGIVARFEKTDLVCYARRDSIVVFKTSGVYIPALSQWKGLNGLVTWERSGYKRDSISANLKQYTIDLTKTSYQADSVVFYNKSYFNYPLTGHLEDNVMLLTNRSNAEYPKFDSYKKHFILKNLYPDVNYEGGFSMQGSKLVGSGTEIEKARLDFFRHDTLRMRAASTHFIFRPDKVIGINTAVVIYLDKDSIYHGDLAFTYIIGNKELLLIKSDNYSAQSPYLNSYHKLDMTFEQLRWKIDEPTMYLTTTQGASIGKALFESLNFFNNEEFMGLQYYDEIHPLTAIKKFAQIEKSEDFSSIDFAHYMNKSIDQVQPMLFPLSLKGFIFYNSQTERIQTRKKMYNALLASAGRIDYDVMRIQSSVDAPLENGYIDLRNNDLRINGIPKIAVSDSQNVIIYPKNATILMKRNRSFQFDGKLIGGLFTFYGKNFFFNYDSFKINLKDIDSIQIKVIVGYDNFQKPIYQEVHNIIEHVTGDLAIDKPDNKSGLKNYPEYPLFRSKENSYVYYDATNIEGGVYKRKNFYFQIYPYLLDSLNKFKKEALEFKGQLESAGIFPTLHNKLMLQQDYSLGLKHETPPEGLPVYGGKGQFYNIVNLSNMGLRGDGKLNYITSSAQSKDFVFYPDSMNTTAPDFTIREQSAGVQYPQVDAKEVYLHWMPYKDKLVIKNQNIPFQMFNKEINLNGSLELASKGLSGKGTMDLTSAVTNSNEFTYGFNTIDADTTTFNLRSLHDKSFTVITSDIKMHVDLGQRKGNFHANKGKSLVEFPENKYLAYLEDFNWNMNKKELEMLSNEKNEPSKAGLKYGFKDQTLIGAKYISSKKEQDSLSFVSPKAVYDYNKNVINVFFVKYIDVADARIIPDKGNVAIEADAKMRTLEKAKIIANTETRFHNFYDATTNITGRNNYTGIGKYDYIDENNKVQQITFSNISVDTAFQTVATGDIVEPDNFTLSPDFSYQGKVKLTASDKFLNFNGSARVVHNCPTVGTQWFRFTTTIDPMNIFIPVGEKLKDINLKPSYLGTFITTDSIHIYSVFFGGRKNFNDSYISTANGFLYFNKDSSSYVVASMNKIKKSSLPGNLICFNRKKCHQYGEGTLNLGIDLGHMKLSTTGFIDHDLNKNKISLHVALGVDFILLDKAMESMAIETDSLLRKDSINLKLQYFKKIYANLLDSGQLTKFYEKPIHRGKNEDYPKELAHSIFFNDVKMIWDQTNRSYCSLGKIGLAYIFDRPINKYVDGFIEIYRRRSGDMMNIYLQIDSNTWYYFGYTRGVMQVLSSNRNFIEPIQSMKPEQRITKFDHIDTYNYLPSPERRKGLFLKRWNDFKNRGTSADVELQQEQPEQNEVPVQQEIHQEQPINPEPQKNPVDTIPKSK